MIAVQNYVSAQQLIVITRDRVRLRFSQGDQLYYATTRNSKVRQDAIAGFLPDRIVLRSNQDTIPLAQIRKLGSLAQHEVNRFQDPGFKILIAGVLLGVGDFINVSAVQDKEYRIDPGVIAVSSALITAGVILLTRKPVVKVNRRNRVLIVNEEPGHSR